MSAPRSTAWLLVALASCAGARAARSDDSGYECFITPRVVVKVGSPVAGVLEKVEVERGDRVRNGQVIAELQSGLERAAVELARAKAEFDKRRVARNSELDQDELISEHERDEMRTQAVVSDLELAEAAERLNMRTIRSPIDGVVVERSHSPGELIQEAAIATIAQTDPLNVEVVLPVAVLGKIRLGDVAQVLPAAPVGGAYQAKVVIVDRVIDAASGTFGVRLELPNPGAKLPAGLRCRVTFASDPKPSVP